jgi:hypothetical protein
MDRENIIRMAHEAGLHLATDVNWMPIIGLEYAEKFAKLVAAKERERIIEANAPELEKANAHIKRLEEHAYDLVGELRVANIKLSMRPPRTWVGLTDEEVESYWDWEDFQCGCGRGTLLDMVRDIEAKLKERNT